MPQSRANRPILPIANMAAPGASMSSYGQIVNEGYSTIAALLEGIIDFFLSNTGKKGFHSPPNCHLNYIGPEAQVLQNRTKGLKQLAKQV